MKRLTRLALASLSLASLSLALPALAHAEEAFVTANVNMRAGPDPGYPLIDQLREGTEVDVQGCTEGYEWCDVIAYDNRGWVAGNYINYEYEDQPVLLPSYGARIGVPIIAFALGTYWANHYSGRSFYRERDHWSRYHYVRRPPPPPPPHPYRGPIHRWSSPGHPGMPHRPGERPGHLGPVGPGYPVHANPPARPEPPGERHPWPRPPMHTQPVHETPMRPAPTGMPHRPGQWPGQLGPVGPGHAVHAAPDRPTAVMHPAPVTRPPPAHQAQPAEHARPAPHQEHGSEHKDDNKHDH